MIKVGILGSTGYAGQQLVWLIENHPHTEIIFLSSHNYSDKVYSQLYGNYINIIQDKCMNIHSAINCFSEIDVLFMALPHGKTFDIVEKALEYGVKIIDLGADYRLKTQALYEDWYRTSHKSPHLLDSAIYGLPELHSEEIAISSLIANPGCYPTASILGIAPLLKSDIVNTSSIVIDAKSGISGAGRNAALNNLFTECNESIKAYGVGSHRHTPEIEQELSEISKKNIILTFTPHLIPMNRGILATCYANLTKSLYLEDIYDIYKTFYKDHYFVRIIEKIPETRWVKGSNFCDIAIRIDDRTNRVVVVSAIDNLIKGAAGQAVQNMNIMFDLNESEGLELISMFP